MGDGYKNYCKQVGGVYLNGEDLRFNPFIGVRNIDESAEGISRLLAVLASPQNPLDDVCEAILLKAVISAYERKKNEALIDDVHAYLTSVEITREYEQKPTIIARLAELALLLDAYCTWGTYGEYFNSPKPTLDGETRFAVLELLSLEDKPKLLSAILFSLILSIQQKMYHSPRSLKKVAIIDEAWRLLSGSNPHAAKFIETGYRTVRRHRGGFITITQGIKDFTAGKEAEAAWNNSSTKITLLQDAKAFKQYLTEYPDQFTEMEKDVIQYFQPALDTGFSSLLINTGDRSSFHRLFVDPVTRAMFSSRGEDFEFMQNAQKAGATSEEAAYLLASRKYGAELEELEKWINAA
jgi:conjugal transfer ATP-binding protein TraC